MGRVHLIEARDGSGNVTQAIHGTQYIDEVVAMVLEDGLAFVHQDANFNVAAVTDPAGRVLERVYASPYGLPTTRAPRELGSHTDDIATQIPKLEPDHGLVDTQAVQT